MPNISMLQAIAVIRYMHKHSEVSENHNMTKLAWCMHQIEQLENRSVQQLIVGISLVGQVLALRRIECLAS